MEDFGLTLIAGGRGPARLPTCECTLRHARIAASACGTFQPSAGVSAIVVRALSFFGPGQLRALRVGDADVFRLVLSMLQPLPGDGASASQMAQAIDSLSVVDLTGDPNDAEDEAHAAAIIERCAATVTELKGHLPMDLLCESECVERPPVLARCTRLELLSGASGCTPAVWLGLSQLHTLHDVDLSLVSTAAVAAALPRLHTLTTHSRTPLSVDGVAGFFTDLLPQLRVFHFRGSWPVESAPSAVAPLPLLEELLWEECSPQCSPSMHFSLPTAFFGARPIVLQIVYDAIAACLTGRGGAPGELTCSLLARVRTLRLSAFMSPSVSDVAQVLRAAPQLRTFRCSGGPRGDTRWLTASTAPLNPAFVDLVHPRLRHFSWVTVGRETLSPDDGCASRLRRTCFPRLREVKVGRKTFSVTPDDTGRHRMQVR
jgi:hypothetical protein